MTCRGACTTTCTGRDIGHPPAPPPPVQTPCVPPAPPFAFPAPLFPLNGLCPVTHRESHTARHMLTASRVTYHAWCIIITHSTSHAACRVPCAGVWTLRTTLGAPRCTSPSLWPTTRWCGWCCLVWTPCEVGTKACVCLCVCVRARARVVVHSTRHPTCTAHTPCPCILCSRYLHLRTQQHDTTGTGCWGAGVQGCGVGLWGYGAPRPMHSSVSQSA
jgi:hypothetical protein